MPNEILKYFFGSNAFASSLFGACKEDNSLYIFGLPDLFKFTTATNSTKITANETTSEPSLIKVKRDRAVGAKLLVPEPISNNYLDQGTVMNPSLSISVVSSHHPLDDVAFTCLEDSII